MMMIKNFVAAEEKWLGHEPACQQCQVCQMDARGELNFFNP